MFQNSTAASQDDFTLYTSSERGHSAPQKSKGSVGLSYSLDTVAQVSRNESITTDARPTQLQVFERYTANLYKEKEKSIERQKLKKQWIVKLEGNGFQKQADKLRRCRSEFSSFLMCASGHKFKAIPTFRCYLPVCPDCLAEKSYRNIRTQLPKVIYALELKPHLKVALMTLTIKSKRDRTLNDGFVVIKKTFRKLRTYPTYKHISEKICGGIGRCEGTYARKYRWHPHLHTLVLLEDYIPQDQLSDAWLKLTGDSQIVDIREVGDLAKGVLECIKYPYKLADINKLGKREILEILDLKGKRLSVAFGDLHGMETPPLDDAYSDFMEATQALRNGDNCPVCWLPLVKHYNISREHYFNILPDAVVNLAKIPPS
jgi:hypothetical protein